jgi:bifunctional non-homologous end joining protein LigD
MLWGVRRGSPRNAPAAFIHCLPTIAKRPPIGPGWAHELKHDGYRLQLHVRENRVRLYTMNGADWTKRYPRIVEEAKRISESAILDAEVVCLSPEGVADFEALHSRTQDSVAVACAFDLLALNGNDLRRRPFVERKAALRKLLRSDRSGIQYVEHADGHGDKMFAAERSWRRHRFEKAGRALSLGTSKAWIKVKNSKAPAAARVLDGTF